MTLTGSRPFPVIFFSGTFLFVAVAGFYTKRLPRSGVARSGYVDAWMTRGTSEECCSVLFSNIYRDVGSVLLHSVDSRVLFCIQYLVRRSSHFLHYIRRDNWYFHKFRLQSISAPQSEMNPSYPVCFIFSTPFSMLNAEANLDFQKGWPKVEKSYRPVQRSWEGSSGPKIQEAPKYGGKHQASPMMERWMTEPPRKQPWNPVAGFYPPSSDKKSTVAGNQHPQKPRTI